jgi:hypothetical protein
VLRYCKREKRRRTEERREEEKRDLDWSLSRSGSFFFCCDSLVFSNKKFCLSRVFKQEVLSLVFSRWCC